MLDMVRKPFSELPPLTGPKREAAERAMRRQWWAVARSADLDTPQPAVLLGERLVVYRTASGQAVVQSRRCPHRGGDFTQGKVHGEAIAGPYHRNGDAILDVQHAFTGSPENARAIMKRHGATLLLVCPNMAESTVYRARSPHGFYSQLAMGKKFPWLVQVPLPARSPLRAFRIE